MLFLSIVCAVVAGLLGFAGRKYWRLTSIQASAATALLAGIVLPLLHVEGDFLAATCTAVSYAAMVSESIVNKPLQMVAISCLTAVIVYLGQDALVGVGGRLGTYAALGIMAFLGSGVIREWLRTLVAGREAKHEAEV